MLRIVDPILETDPNPAPDYRWAPKPTSWQREKGEKVHWETPDALFKVFDDRFHFTLDVCANADNHKVNKYYGIEADGLIQNWGHNVCWMSPPYDRALKRWVRRAAEECFYHGATVVGLLPARTDSKWWAEWVIPFASEIIFLTGRVRFKGAKNSAPFGSVVVVWLPSHVHYTDPTLGPQSSTMLVVKGG